MELYVLPVILLFSIILQIVSAVAALLMVKTSGYYKPWIFISVAILLMGIRRITTFANMLRTGIFPPTSFVPEIIALCISILLLTGLMLLRPMFLDISKKHQKSELDIKTQKILLKEINHRVKNNLLMINSLVELKQRTKGMQVDLSDIIHQIDTIRIIHEKLNHTDDISNFEMREYIEDLLDSIFATFHQQPVLIKNEVDDIRVSSDKALPLGLIINEIATNAIKYGFTVDQKAVFTVEMHEDPKKHQYNLKISNTGVPFPEHISPDNPDTLGLRLISALTDQLKGTISLKKKPYPEYQITVPDSNI